MKYRDQISDQILVLRCREGDVNAFDQLVGQWQERLWRHALRLTGHEDAAWDVTQESWMGISRGIGSLQDPAAFSGWAYQIVSNKCRDWIRREQRRRRGIQSYADQFIEPSNDGTESFASLREALERLSPPDQTIISLRYEEGFDTTEIAGILGIPEGTVRSRLHYTRKRLRTLLEEPS